MILIDTSAWIEYLRDTGSATCERVQQLLAQDVAIADPIRMEVLAGARDEHHILQLRRLLARGTNFQALSMDYDHAAALYRQCRAKGETVRKLIHCLIAAIAIRNDVTLLHQDADFEMLARSTALTTE